MSNYSYDLFVLVADRDMEASIQGILSRHESLGIKEITTTIKRHHNRDSGCFKNGFQLMRDYASTHKHGLLIFDRHGCGKENRSREQLEVDVCKTLSINGWGNRAEVIIIDPELENWIWSDSPEVDRCLKWDNQDISLRGWLKDKDLWQSEHSKPADPKSALITTIRETNKPLSPSIFQDLARTVSLNRCTDPSFEKLKSTLKLWFSE